MELPKILMDNEGYPTEEWLTFIREYKPGRPGNMPIMDLVELLRDNWYHGEYGFKIFSKYKGKQKIEISTLGWSGNEDTMSAILDNIFLTHGALKYFQWNRGGHYRFEINHNFK